MPQRSHPLSESELTELDEFLLSETCDEETLSLDEAHGYLTALAAGPVQMEEAAWLQALYGEPRFIDEGQAAHIRGLLVRLKAQIEDELRQGEPFEPLIVEEEEEGELFETYEGWCFGFMLGVEQCEQHWDTLPKDQQAMLAPMAQLALLATEEEPTLDEEEYAAWVELIPGAVAGLYRFWRTDEA